MFRSAVKDNRAYTSSTSFSHLKDTLFGKESWAVAELQQQVADLKLEKQQLLTAVTEQQHDAACLAQHVAQIGQLKQVLANLQQHNAELEATAKALPHEGEGSTPGSPEEVRSLKAKVGQLQNRLAFMEDEKTRLITAAKNKNEQVTTLEQRCQKLESEVQKLAQTWSEAAPAEEIKVARQGSLAEQQLHQQQLQALHDDLQAVREQYSADAETWSSEQAALQADLAALAAQTALKSLALDAMMRNSSRGAQGGVHHTIGGPLWQQDQETLTRALVAEKEWLATLTQKITEVQDTLQQTKPKSASHASPAPASQPAASQGESPAQPAQSIAQAASQLQSAPQPQKASDENVTVAALAAPVSAGYQSNVTGTAAAHDDSGIFTLPVTAADAKVEAPARLQLTLGAELADDDHHLVHEQHHRQHRYRSTDIETGPAIPKIRLAFGGQPGSKRSTRTTRDEDSSWTLLSHNARPDSSTEAVPLGDAPVGTLASDASVLMKGVFAAGTGSLFSTDGPNAQPGREPMHRMSQRTADAEPLAAKQSVRQALYGQ